MRDILTVSNLNDSGVGSLREAINISNKVKHKTYYLIKFSVFGTINLKSDLPQIEYPLEINGFNENDITKPGITINGMEKYKVFDITNTNHVKILYICIIKSTLPIRINKCIGVSIEKCWLGLDTNGNVLPNCANGIEIIKSKDCIIGTNESLEQNNFSNVISGNKKNGILLLESEGNVIQNNIIGLNAECNKIIPNKLNGITVKSSKNNIIGGKEFVDKDGNINNPTGNKGTTTQVFVRPLLGNIISGNKENGIKFCSCQTNEVKGNFIGTGNTGTIRFPNQKCGIVIINSQTIKILGCNTDTNPFIYYNVISGNLGPGIYVNKSKFTLVQGNFIGLGADNSTPVPNYVGYVESNTISTVFGGIIPLGNVVSGNHTNGFHITTNSIGFTSINTFSGNAAFGPAVPNGRNGFLIDKNAKEIKINTNIISGNSGNGIEITDNVRDVILTSNLIGVDSLDNPMPNNGSGIVIGGNASNILFDIIISSVIPRNTISANKKYGIILKDNTHSNTLSSLFVGLAYLGDKFIGYSNGLGGILITDKATNNKIGNSINLETYCYIADKENFAVKFTENTSNNILNYNFINVTIFNLPVIPHGLNIIDEGKNNVTFNNNIPYL